MFILIGKNPLQRSIYYETNFDHGMEKYPAGALYVVQAVLSRQPSGQIYRRAAVQNAPVYEALTNEEKAAFNRLYNHYFYERHDKFWAQEALKKLPELIDATRMLVCGEDLGMIPNCVKGVMDTLRILSLEIQRMPKNPAETFGNPAHFPYRSVCTISTHDMSTLRGWWKEDFNQTCNYFYNVLHGWGDCPQEASGAICDTIVLNHLLGNSMLCILSLQDWLSINEDIRYPDIDAERINIPANPRHYWRYRMHLTIEQLLQASTLNTRITEIIQKSGRNRE